MHLFTVILPLAIQAAVVHAVPPGLPTKYAYQRDVSHDASLTASTVGGTPTAGIHNRDVPPGKLHMVLFDRNTADKSQILLKPLLPIAFR
jgi:hypothetical protein